jgi:uncharacterized protein (TIGR02444 family)
MSNNAMAEPNPSQALWDFALAFYAQPDVAQTCLRLQDEYQANVCLLIAMSWLDARQHHLADAEFLALQHHIAGWTQTVVEPLRLLRQRLKLPFEDFSKDEMQLELRNILKQAELLAEKKLLIEIERWLGKHSRATAAATHGKNVERYANELKTPKNLVAIISGSV